MKIKRLVESKLIEEEERDEEDIAELVDAPAGEEGTAEIDPATDSVKEISDAIQDETIIASDGEAELNKDDAIKMAMDAKQTAADINAGNLALVPTKEDFDSIVIENRLTHILDHALVRAKGYMRRGKKTGANVLIEGLPGSGKTAIVESWAARNGLILVSMNAADSKADISVNGAPLPNASSAGEADGLVYKYALDKLGALLDKNNAGKCVLFVDEFNRQRDSQLRRTFLSLFNEKRNADGKLDFRETLLFSIVCINPAGEQYHDPGTVKLNQAERTRFIKDIKDFDSNPKESMAFYAGNLQKALLQLGIYTPGSQASKNHNGYVGPWKELTDEDYEDIDEELRVFDLARFILDVDGSEHPLVPFAFDGRDVLDDINDGDYQLLNSRKLTDMLYDAEGYSENILAALADSTDPDNIKSSDINLLPETEDMLRKILEDYVLDMDKLYKEFGIPPKNGTGSAEIPTDVQDSGAGEDVEEPSDEPEGFFNDSDEPEVDSPDEVDAKTFGIVNGWKK